MKKSFLQKVVGNFLVVLLILMLFSTSSLADKQKLMVVGSWSNLTLYQNLERPFWEETLPEASNGKIGVTLTTLGQIDVRGAAVLRQMEMGLFDVVTTCAHYVLSDCPELAAFDLPVITFDVDEALKVADAYRPVLSELVEETFNAKLLCITLYPAQILFLNKKISGLHDLAGLKIRAASWPTAKFIESLGGTTLDIPFGDVPQSLQRGIADGAVTGGLSGYSSGWGEITKYLYPLPLGGWSYYITVMNMDVWNSFSKEEQSLIESLIIKEVEEPNWAITKVETQEGIEHLTRGKEDGEEYTYGEPNDMELIEVMPEDIEIARQILMEKVLPIWVAQVDEEAIEKWNKTIGEVIGIQLEK